MDVLRQLLEDTSIRTGLTILIVCLPIFLVIITLFPLWMRAIQEEVDNTPYP